MVFVAPLQKVDQGPSTLCCHPKGAMNFHALLGECELPTLKGSHRLGRLGEFLRTSPSLTKTYRTTLLSVRSSCYTVPLLMRKVFVLKAWKCGNGYYYSYIYAFPLSLSFCSLVRFLLWKLASEGGGGVEGVLADFNDNNFFVFFTFFSSIEINIG